MSSFSTTDWSCKCPYGSSIKYVRNKSPKFWPPSPVGTCTLSNNLSPFVRTHFQFHYCFMTVKPLNRGHLLVLKHLSVIKMYLLLAGSLTKIVTFGTKHFVRYSRHVRYLGCPLLGGSTVLKLYLFSDKNIIFCIN